MITCQILDALGQQYGTPPSELLKLTPMQLAFNYSVMRKAQAE